MDKKTCENHIRTLKKVRGVCSSQLDDSAKAVLDDAIEMLERHLERQSEVQVATLVLRVFQAIAVVVSITTDIRDWM